MLRHAEESGALPGSLSNRLHFSDSVHSTSLHGQDRHDAMNKMFLCAQQYLKTMTQGTWHGTPGHDVWTGSTETCWRPAGLIQRQAWESRRRRVGLPHGRRVGFPRRRRCAWGSRGWRIGFPCRWRTLVSRGQQHRSLTNGGPGWATDGGVDLHDRRAWVSRRRWCRSPANGRPGWAMDGSVDLHDRRAWVSHGRWGRFPANGGLGKPWMAVSISRERWAWVSRGWRRQSPVNGGLGRAAASGLAALAAIPPNSHVE